jgi:hypothetical protein
VRTEHGNAAEAALRQWLSAYLPARYGVTSGYIIPDVVVPEYKLYHFDVIIYDVLNAPILWIDGDYDTSDQGRKRAVPAKDVWAVLEVKASLTPSSATEAISKLSQLNALSRYLPKNFSCGTFFYELDATLVNNQSILPNLIPDCAIVGYWGGVTLRCQMDEKMTDLMHILPRPANGDQAKESADTARKGPRPIGRPSRPKRKRGDNRAGRWSNGICRARWIPLQQVLWADSLWSVVRLEPDVVAQWIRAVRSRPPGAFGGDPSHQPTKVHIRSSLR